MERRTDLELRLVAGYKSGTEVRRALHDDGIRWAIEALRERNARIIEQSVTGGSVAIDADFQYLESLLKTEEE